MMNSPTPLQKQIRKQFDSIPTKIYKQYDIKLVYLFGSFVTERFDDRADVDVALLFKNGLKSTQLFQRAALFQTKVLKNIDAKLDISILNLATPLLKYEVIVNGDILFVDDFKDRTAFEIKVYKDYEDYCYVQDIYFKFLRERVRKAVRA